MPDYKINDKWITDRISSQSNSFNQWFSDLMSSIETMFNEFPPEALEELKKNKHFKSVRDIKKELTEAQKELESLGSLGKIFSGIGSMGLNWIKRPIEEELKKVTQKTKVDDFGFDLDMILGKRKISLLHSMMCLKREELNRKVYYISYVPYQI